METKIKVYNDFKVVYEGTALGFIRENENEEEIIDFVNEALSKGKADRLYFSGEWRIEVA